MRFAYSYSFIHAIIYLSAWTQGYLFYVFGCNLALFCVVQTVPVLASEDSFHLLLCPFDIRGWLFSLLVVASRFPQLTKQGSICMCFAGLKGKTNLECWIMTESHFIIYLIFKIL